MTIPLILFALLAQEPKEVWLDCGSNATVETPKGSFSLRQTQIAGSNFSRIRGLIIGDELRYAQSNCSGSVMIGMKRNAIAPVEYDTIPTKSARIGIERRAFVLFELGEPILLKDRLMDGIIIQIDKCTNVDLETEKAEQLSRELAQAKFAQEAIRAVNAKYRAVKARLSPKRVSDLTVADSEEMAVCKASGAW